MSVMSVMREMKIVMIATVTVIACVIALATVSVIAIVLVVIALVVIQENKMTDHEVLVFVTTMNCNRHCKFCNQERNHTKFGCSITDMSVETFIELVSKHPDNATITLSGGEPFLNLPIMEWLVKKNRPFCVQTNGDFLFPKDWKIPENT